MKKILFVFLSLAYIAWAIPTANAQSKKNKSSNEYQLVYSSGDSQNGHAYLVFEKVYYANSGPDIYSYWINEGTWVDGKLNGWGSVLKFSFLQKVDFVKRETDSIKATTEINLLPVYYTQSGKKEDSITLKNYEYYIGNFNNGYLKRGVSYESAEGKRLEGVFNTKGLLDYGSFTMRYKDTLVRGFLCESEEALYNFTPCDKTSLHYYIADSSFIMIPYHNGQRLTNLITFPMSTYHADRKAVINMRFNNGVYNGEAYKGKPEGLGEWISDDGEFIEYGYFKNGVAHGLFCKNFHEFNPQNNEYRYEVYPTKVAIKGVSVGIFNNGKPGKLYVKYKDMYYEGDVNDRFLPDGYGSLTYKWKNMTEVGNFWNGRLDGYGTRTYPDKKVERGTFSVGDLTNGITQLSVRSLQQYNVVKVNGKRLMVMEKIWDNTGNAYVKLSDGSSLFQGDRFEMDYGGDNDFYITCEKCNGTGSIYQTNTYKYWAGNDYTTEKKVERIGGQNYIKTNVISTPKYIEQTTTNKEICIVCNGKGKLLKRK